MSKIVSIGTAVPAHCHQQGQIMQFMQQVYCMNDVDRRKMRFVYGQCGIQQRYSAIPDYGCNINDWEFYPQTENLDPFPNIEKRMALYNKVAPQLSADAIQDCLGGKVNPKSITHLITVSCTGLSAPGLDLQVMELMDLDKNIMRTSVNFMGCYAAIHALKIADAFCKSSKHAKVMIVCTELCTLHFQRENTQDNIASSLLFGDGAAAVLVTPDTDALEGWQISDFYSEIVTKGKQDMAWEVSSTGFLMTLSGYIPDLIEADFAAVVTQSLAQNNLTLNDITDWCIHPGGKRILEAIQKSMKLTPQHLQASYDVLNRYGNMSSATVLFVLKALMEDKTRKERRVFGAAFGPGLTVETFSLVA